MLPYGHSHGLLLDVSSHEQAWYWTFLDELA